ncbi:hypothetical protein [Paenibacillus senegalensis]|uniref:hypothetical protein n=1 Tax=Paenibacillus senegalensis TaxID=1465766 RepID=UPI0002888612|nr:hypothetical protein [Paenibacillus senegalensis]
MIGSCRTFLIGIVVILLLGLRLGCIPGKATAAPHYHPEAHTREAPHTHHNEENSEISTEVSYDANRLFVQIRDKDGRSPVLTVNHEKEMHLIIVSRDLKSFFHVHPERLDNGDFAADVLLPDGDYRVFVDITPRDHSYAVAAHTLEVGNTDEGEAPPFWSASPLTQEIEGRRVTLEAGPIHLHESSNLRFHLHGAKTEPYLGAKGHVVLIDETAQTYIHVHPVAEDVLEFSAHFEKPGRYKLWAEFNFPGQGVLAFPFTIEVPSK